MSIISCAHYDIVFEEWELLAKKVSNQYSSTIVIVDENTEVYCLPILSSKIANPLDIITIPAGEEFKTLHTATFVWNEMLNRKADRQSLCINLGGGVIGDLGGWAASSFMRGMDFIQIPTTLLSMVDASVGGKLGIDFQGVKNLVGLIKDPSGVFIFPEFLETLPEAQLKSGYAEVLKHGLIADQAYWNQVKKWSPLEIADWTALIHQSVQIKKAVVEKDPLEKGLRKILNFGHTIGHAIESLSFSHNVPLLHGEAIGIGMITEAHLSHQYGFLDVTQLEEITEVCKGIYGVNPDYIPSLEDIYPLLLKDKKNIAQKVMFSLLENIGSAIYNQEVSQEEIQDSLEYYRGLG